MDYRDSPFVHFAQLATDSRGRRRGKGKKDQCLLSWERKDLERRRERKSPNCLRPLK